MLQRLKNVLAQVKAGNKSKSVECRHVSQVRCNNLVLKLLTFNFTL